MRESHLDILRSGNGAPLRLGPVTRATGDEIEWALLVAEDGEEMAVVDGVVLADDSPDRTSGRIASAVMPHLRTGSYEGARKALRRASPIIDKLLSAPGSMTLTGFMPTWFRRGYRIRYCEERPSGPEYLETRTANTSWLTAQPLMPRGLAGNILDLGCGAGHFSHLIGRHNPDSTLITSDVLFIDVLACRHFMRRGRPDLQIVFDAQKPFPLATDSLDAVFNIDSLQYMNHQADCLAQVRRCLRESGDLVFSHLHNRAFGREILSLGNAHDRAGWTNLFRDAGFDNAELWSDADMLGAHDSGTCPDGPDPSVEPVDVENYHCLAGGSRVDGRPLADPGPWAINPIFEDRSGHLTLVRPSHPHLASQIQADLYPESFDLQQPLRHDVFKEACRNHVIQPMSENVYPPDRYVNRPGS